MATNSRSYLWLLLCVLITACDSGGSGGGNTGSSITLDNCSASNDTDNDGLNDCAELTGWDVIVDRNGEGTTVTETVSSNPEIADTDGDGLDDFGESNSRTDPTLTDTDGDGLSDNDELITFRSDPRDVDTDDDARGPDNDLTPNTALFDGNEYLLSGTSPTLADTDGDNKTDYEEIIGGGTSPLIANIPQMEISFVGDINVDINRTDSTNCTTTTNTTQTTLNSDTSSVTKTSAQSTKNTVTQNAEIKAEVETAIDSGNWPPSASLKTTASASVAAATVQENATSLTTNSKNSAQNDYKELFENNCVTSSNFSDASVSTQLDISNSGGFAYNLSNLNLSLQRVNADTSSFSVISSQNVFSTGTDIAAGQTIGSVPVSFTIGLGDARELLKNPSELTPVVSQYTMSNQDGFSYAYLNDTTIDRTGLVIIDYGDGTVERYLIATNVNRNPDGSAAGATMTNIMEIIGLTEDTTGSDTAGTYRTTSTVATVSGVATTIQALASLNGYADNELAHKFWQVTGSGSSFDTTAVNFNDIVLEQGDAIYISLLTDSDSDGLYNREERIYGTHIDMTDTDGDGINDYDEIRVGWTNGFDSSQVYSSATNSDADGDGADDAAEMAAGTDPRSADTDGDGYQDNTEILTAGLDPLVHNIQVTTADYVGNENSYALKNNNRLWSWGYSAYGELMSGANNNVSAPAQANIYDWQQVSAGRDFVAAMDTNGDLFAAGYGTHDSTVNPDPSIFALPNPAGLPAQTYVYVSAGGYDIMAIATNGSLWRWTLDYSSALNAPVPVGSDTDRDSVSVGDSHFLAIKQNGSLWAWGANTYGQLGLSDNTTRSTPVQVGTSTDWKEAHAALNFSVAIRDNQTLWAWGRNNNNQLGLADTTDRNAPNHVCIIASCGLNDEQVWGTVAASEFSSSAIALQVDGTLWGWGQNLGGTVGVGNTSPVGSPQQVGTDSDWALIASGGHSLAIKATGTLWVWGTGGGSNGLSTPTQEGVDTDWNTAP